ncbi:MAG: hypothetical protein ACM30I_17255 [Gemmatimonas sp.]
MMHLLLSIILLVVVLYPTARVLRRAGRHPLWCLITLVPIVNIVALWVFAYTPWPGVVETQKPDVPTYH